MAVLPLDRQHGPVGDHRRDGRAHRVRGHGHDACRADGDRLLLGSLHAALVPRPRAQGTLALLAGTLAFSFSLLRRVETNFVPDIGVTVAGVLVAAGLVLFLLFFNRFVHRLRPVAVAEIVARQLQRSLRDVIALLAHADDIFVAPAKGVDGQPALAIRSDRPGAIQAINFPEVAQWARKHGCLALIKHPIGDFVQVGDPLFEIYGDPGDAAEAERTLNGLVALGIERTIEQDPAFALRIMVDVANKALSAAINDPTTAVQVLNYIEGSLGRDRHHRPS